MSRGSGGAIGLGALALAASWLTGSIAVAVVGIGFLGAGLWARAWSRRVVRALSVEQHIPEGRTVEGEDVAVEITVHRQSRWPVGGAYISHAVTLFGTERIPLRGDRGRVVATTAPRGRYPLGPVCVELYEPLGLESVTATVSAAPLLIVDPRLEELDALFTDSGALHEGGARARLRRPGGFELHAVREYQPGEPLRAVHWPSTARRAELMVKELDDVPREDVVVVLDQHPNGVAGTRGRSSLDAAVRAAGTIVRAYAGRGRRGALLLTGGHGSVVRVQSLDREWAGVLDALAAAEADAERDIGTVLADTHFPAARAPELVVVTALPFSAAAMLEQRSRDGRATSLVAVDAPTYAGAAPATADPVLLRLAAAGVRIATLRAGDDLRGALGGAPARRAHA